MRIVTVVGARPQFIKAAPVSRAIRERHEEILVHTGQHFDPEMSDVFFSELGIPHPDHHLNVSGGTHGRMTGRMLEAVEGLIVDAAPDWVVVYGDTNSTLAGALAAVKLGVPVAHIEAGLRSFNRAMPEEINRVLTDHASTLLLCPTDAAVRNLAAEGITTGVHQVGDVMLDTARLTAEKVDVDEVLARYGVEEGEYYLATVHRAATTDDPEALARVVRAFERLDRPVVFPVHPRTAQSLRSGACGFDIIGSGNIRMVPPASYLDMSALLRGATALLTDSGGMQKEAYFFRVPCVTLRSETEWVETVEDGWNVLVGTDEEAIVAAATSPAPGHTFRPLYGTGHAALACVRALEMAGI